MSFLLSAGIQKYSRVTVQIAAETSAGVGPYSEIVTATTKQDSMAVLHTLLAISYTMRTFHSSICTNSVYGRGDQ